jgi:hypothetical protein
MAAKLPSTLQTAYILTIVAGAFLGCCGLYSGVGLVAQQMLDASAQLPDAPSDPALHRAFELQRSMLLVSTVTMVLQLACSAGLVVGGALGTSGRPIGRTITLGAYALTALATVADAALTVWTWTVMGDVVGSAAGPAMGPDEQRMMLAITVASLAPSVCWLIFKLGAIAAGGGVLLSREANDFYARIGPEGLSPGPRG